MLIESLIANPRVLSEDEIEEYANVLVKEMADKEATYGNAYLCLKAHTQVFKEAVYHLGHNAVIEMGANPVKFVLNE